MTMHEPVGRSDRGPALTVDHSPDAAMRMLRRWPTAYPRHRGLWTLRGDADRWGSFDPDTGVAAPTAPADDPALPGLAEALGSGTLIGYRVGRRAIVATPDGFTKVLRPKRVEPIAATHRWLAAACPAVDTPAITAASATGSIELSVVPGRSLHSTLRNPTSAAQLDRAIARIAAAIALLHATSPASHLPEKAVEKPSDWVETVACGEPRARSELFSIVARLPALEPAPTVVVHGDLHDKNIFHRPGGVGLIDLDGVGLGAPEDDVANLAVHLHLRALQAGHRSAEGRARANLLYRCYRQYRALDRRRIEAAERHTWFRLACIYRFRAASRHLVPELLRRSVDDR